MTYTKRLVKRLTFVKKFTTKLVISLNFAGLTRVKNLTFNLNPKNFYKSQEFDFQLLFTSNPAPLQLAAPFAARVGLCEGLGCVKCLTRV